MVILAIKANLTSIVHPKMTSWLMCRYKLERRANEDEQLFNSAKRNLHQEFQRLPVIQIFKKPVKNFWFINECSVLKNNVLNNMLHLIKTFCQHNHNVFFCAITCNVKHVNVSCLCSFIIQNSTLNYLFS